MIRLRHVAPLLLLAAAPTPAQAADTVLAPAADTAGITAYGGHVVLSRRDASTNRWALVRWHAGVFDVLPVPERSVPFDADAGPDATGDPVVVYSRCAQDPPNLSGSPGGTDFGAGPAPDWQTARGCDVYELSLSGTPTEHKLTAASSASRSETTPSIWRGGLAFARHADGGSVAKLLYLPKGSAKPRSLGAGSVQACERDCGALRNHAGIDQLDIGPSRAAYLWRMSGGAVSGTGIGWELRAASLTGGRSTLLSSGQISGACGFHLPSGPTATTPDGLVSYVDAGSDCGPTTTSFATIDPRTGALGSAATPGGRAVAAVRDGDTIFWLRSTGPAIDVPIPGVTSCSIAGAGCELVASPVPAYEQLPSRLEGSPARIDLVRSGLGYRWVRGPGDTQLLRPPATIPCAPSSQPAYVYTAARWSKGPHRVAVLRKDAGKPARAIRTPQTVSYPKVVDTASTRLVRCGDRTRLTYVVTTNGRARRVSFTVARARMPAR
ncbi:MAG: hypothetical protein QOG15_3 [Solirubrobacteraceae bacterium]|jgi:hypothetical protein|nr:hypothetical protein [Solirubrobacteraceae bacterium]